jgi:hypothetical protein
VLANDGETVLSVDFSTRDEAVADITERAPGDYYIATVWKGAP